ncbi:MAG: lysophospholipid acyltransferase family protein [Actinomycetota bacterium]
MSQAGRRERALALVQELAGADVRIEPGMRLDGAGLDSLAFAELAAALERELGVDLAFESVEGTDRIEDVMRAVENAPTATGRTALPRGIGSLQGPADVLGGWALRWWFRVRIEGAVHVPRRGPAIVAMNHESALDVPLVVAASRRPITFMAKKELFKNGFASWSLNSLGAFRVDRDRFDLVAVQRALAVLERADVLGMYPEGTRSPGRLLPFLHGAAWLALHAGVPLVPCSISGTEHAGRATSPGRVPVRIRFHEAIAVERSDDPAERRRRAAQLTARLREAIEADLRRGVDLAPGPLVPKAAEDPPGT